METPPNPSLRFLPSRQILFGLTPPESQIHLRRLLESCSKILGRFLDRSQKILFKLRLLKPLTFLTGGVVLL